MDKEKHPHKPHPCPLVEDILVFEKQEMIT